MKKKLFVGAAIGTAGLVALTGATFAHEGDNPGTDVRDRVAEILGIEPEELQSAVRQAREEHRDDHLSERLAYAVEHGVITQEEADAISDWLDAMPESLEGVMGYGKRHGFGHILGAAGSEERIAAMLERLVESGKIAEEDVDDIATWIADAPVDALQKLGQGHDEGDRSRDREHDLRRGHGFRGRMFGEGPDGRLFDGRFQIRPYAPPADMDEVGPSNTAASFVLGESA